MAVAEHCDWRGRPMIWVKGIDPRFDTSCGHNVYSQFGEDGLIKRAIELFGSKNRWCFEVGAADGHFYSNTLVLREAGWQAVLIEANDNEFSKLKKNYGDRAVCIHETAGNLDAILARTDCPYDLDFGVIDIDGMDYELWERMVEYRPRIVLIEYSPYVQVDQQRDKCGQANLTLITQLGKAKGYVPLARTFCNLLFVDGEIYGRQAESGCWEHAN